MGRKANYSNNEVAVVRRHFGLTQDEMARFVGVSPQMIAHVEAGRRAFNGWPSMRLIPFFVLLPPPHGTGPADPPDPALSLPPAPSLVPRPAGVTDTQAWEGRRREADYQAFRLRYELENRLKKRCLARRLQQVLPQLAALPPERVDTDADKARRQRWLDWHQSRVNAALADDSPLGLAELTLLRWRLWLLETEEAQLRHWLAP